MQDKKTLITIIVLLCITLPMAIYGTYKHFSDTKKPTKKNTEVLIDDNPNKDFVYNGKVYFYDNDKLLGTYACSNCSEVVTTIDDMDYHTNYYKYGEYKLNPVIGSEAAIFSEESRVNYYSLSTKKVITSYEAIKNYGLENSLGISFVKDSGKWGAIAISTFPATLYIPMKYDYMSIPTHFQDDKLDATKLIVKDDSNWHVIDSSDNVIYTSQKEIVDFNTNYYVLYDNGYHIVDGVNNEYYSNVNKSFVTMAGEYVGIVVNNTLLIINNFNESILKSEQIDEFENLYLIDKDNSIEVYLDGKLSKTIELTGNI